MTLGQPENFLAIRYSKCSKFFKNYLFHYSHFPPLVPTAHSFLSHSSSLPQREGAPPISPPLFLGPQISRGLTTSSPLRPDQADLLYLCQGPLTSLCMLLVGGSSLSSLGSGSACWFSCGVALPFSFNPSPNSTVGVPNSV